MPNFSAYGRNLRLFEGEVAYRGNLPLNFCFFCFFLLFVAEEPMDETGDGRDAIDGRDGDEFESPPTEE